MKDNNNNNDDDNSKDLSPAVLERFLSVQEKEISLREKELVHAQKTNEFAHEYSLKALDVQAKDMEGARQHESKNTIYRYGFSALVIFLLFTLFIVAIFFNKDAIVMEIVKVILYVGVGALGGYSFAEKSKKSNKSDDE